MAVIVIADEMFDLSTAINTTYPNWVKSAGGSEEEHDMFILRCRLISLATSGDVRSLAPILLSVTSEKILKDLILELLEIRLLFFGLNLGDVQSMNVSDDEEWFVNNFNDLAGLPLSEHFHSKSQILRFYYSGALTGIGEEIIQRL